MKKWTLKEQATTPDGKLLSLHERDGSYVIRIDGTELMSTRMHASEDQLAELACRSFATKPGVRILVGGLGMGYTLKAALAVVRPDARVVVAEIMAPVVAWNRNPEYPLAADALCDSRVELHHGDVALLLKNVGTYDAILLDVDNGPAALSADRNKSLYSRSGILTARAALKLGGCVAYWSASEDIAFAKLMREAGLEVEVHRVHAHGMSGTRHAIYLGWKRP